MTNLISLREYAELHGVTPDTVRQKVLRGGFKTAQKIGRNWVIDKNEPYIDLRKKEGQLAMDKANANKEKLKKSYLEFSHFASDGSIDKNDLQFANGMLIRNAEIHLDIDFDKQSDDQTEEFRLVSEYWDDSENVARAIDEANKEDIEEVE